MDDAAIVALYWACDPQAVAHSQHKYGPYCFTVANHMLGSREDAEECVNDTWLHAWNNMPPQRPGVLRLFLAKLTRRAAISRYRARTAEKRGGGELPLALDELGECIASETDVEGEAIAAALGAAIRRFVRALPTREGDVFCRRYFFTEPVADIARRYGLSENHTAVLLRRTRARLKQYLIEEGWMDEPGRSV